jgi:hypothetical protein
MPIYDEEYWIQQAEEAYQQQLEEYHRQEQAWFDAQVEQYYIDMKQIQEQQEEREKYPLFFWKENM